MGNAAFISDIHANLEALEAVLADIGRRGIEEIYCLGDVVGYGPDPEACTDIIMARCRVTIKGNHDDAVIEGPLGFNLVAKGAIDWTRKRLRPRFWKAGSAKRWNFLRGLPKRAEWGGFLLVHGTPKPDVETSEYIMDRDIQFGPPGKFSEIFSLFESVCLVGHTHIPGIFYEGPRWVPQRELPECISYEGKKMVINVGSVGQPRDHDPRACYVTYEGGAFRYNRIEYDFRKTQAKLRDIPQLDPRLSERIAKGE